MDLKIGRYANVGDKVVDLNEQQKKESPTYENETAIIHPEQNWHNGKESRRNEI
jgi:hypothetical protein